MAQMTKKKRYFWNKSLHRHIKEPLGKALYCEFSYTPDRNASKNDFLWESVFDEKQLNYEFKLYLMKPVI